MLPDLLGSGLRVVFVGTSVAKRSAAAGHYYSNPTNKFWQLLAATGLSEGRPVGAPRDTTLPSMGIGLTDLVKGCAASGDSLLASGDYDIPGFISKIEAAAPQVVAFNGGEAARRVARSLGYGELAEGPADWRIGTSLVYRLPSSSASASIGTQRKMAAWRAFGDWVRRETKSRTAAGMSPKRRSRARNLGDLAIIVAARQERGRSVSRCLTGPVQPA